MDKKQTTTHRGSEKMRMCWGACWRAAGILRLLDSCCLQPAACRLLAGVAAGSCWQLLPATGCCWWRPLLLYAALAAAVADADC